MSKPNKYSGDGKEKDITLYNYRGESDGYVFTHKNGSNPVKIYNLCLRHSKEIIRIFHTYFHHCLTAEDRMKFGNSALMFAEHLNTHPGCRQDVERAPDALRSYWEHLQRNVPNGFEFQTECHIK